MMKLGIEIKKTAELAAEEIRKINMLKNRYWKYTEQEHMTWFKENIGPEDWHLLVWKDSILLAYLNIIHVDVSFDYDLYRLMGIGNVCTAKEHSGAGAIMMATANAFVKKMNACGILLCKNNIVLFYKKSNWEMYDASEVFVASQKYTHNIMVYDPYRYLPESAEKVLFHKNF